MIATLTSTYVYLKALVPGIVVAKQEPPSELIEVVDDFEAKRFAVKDGSNGLSQWFPQINENEDSGKWRIWSSRRSRALMMQISLILVVFFINLSLTIIAIKHYGSKNGVGLVYEGNCTTVADFNLWFHLLINLLSTGMLSASNFCMQLQAAPTRDDIEKAHQKGRCVDIGVPSLRNLKFISTWRRLTWISLAFTSLPIHFL